jgi:MinD superfamily P-loop ATPase
MQENNQTKKKWIIGILVGCGCITIAIVILMSSMLLLGAIAIPTFVKAADKARIVILEDNFDRAQYTVMNTFNTEDSPASEVVDKTLNQFEASQVSNPFDQDEKAFSKTVEPGVVQLKAIDDKTIQITAYGKNMEVIEETTIVDNDKQN